MDKFKFKDNATTIEMILWIAAIMSAVLVPLWPIL